MKRWGRGAALFLLLAFTAFAQQPEVTRGGALKRRAYQTYAALTLYVDPTGSDSNPCTASGTSACLTFAGALAKIPRFIRHAVTVNIAAGTYTEAFTIRDFKVDGSTGSLTITGTSPNVTPTTGSATGTLTGYSASATTTHTSATDSGATWTVNDFKGKFLSITGGTGSGQFMPIVSNTSTTLSLAASFTVAPTAGSTYAIVSPAAIFTGTSATYSGIEGSGSVSMSDISIQPSSGSGWLLKEGTAPLTWTRMRLVAATSSMGLGTAGTPLPAWTIRQSVIAAGTGALFNAPATVMSITHGYLYCTTTCAGGVTLGGANRTNMTSFVGTIEANTATLLSIRSSQSMQSTGLWFDCGANTNTAISVPAADNTNASFVGSAFVANGGPYINGCGTGYALNAPSFTYIDLHTVFNNVTTAISMSNGARAELEAGATFTSVTTQITLDGTNYLDSDLTTYTRITGPQGSFISR